MPAGAGASAEFGVYVHIPFCASRCDYCAFVTTVGRLDRANDYVDACLREIAAARNDGSFRTPTTVFFGGGTPSLLPTGLLTKLLEAIAAGEGAEITVEANPESASAGFLSEARRAGVTRISLGAQSFVPRVLEALGREHTVGSIERAVSLIGEIGFPTFNLDLIYGTVAESDEDLEETLRSALALQPSPPHLSAYALTVEAGTPLSRQPDRHPDDDVLARRYEMVDSRLELSGLRWYEISNWARPGHECRHNLACWRGAEYRGIGCAAHSHVDGRRFANVSSVERYISYVNAGQNTVAFEERLDERGRALEQLELSLRTRDGVPLRALPPDDSLAGLVHNEDGRVVLTRRGRLLANEVALRLQTGEISSVGALRGDQFA
jgi:putative oxygen-independent coproporphyrinogen III oxidase